MSIRSILLIILLATAFFLSGCISGKDGNKVNNTEPTDFFPKANLPSGYSFETVHEVEVRISNSSFNATEGLYRYNSGYAEIQAVKHENPTSLIDLYRSQYKEANYNPFEEITFNNHKATIVTDYIIRNGKQEPKYTVIWTNGSYMFLAMIEEQIDSKTLVSFAAASGY